MSELFLSVLNMSLAASYVILFVMLVRLLFKKAPKVISYALWSVVAFRLIIPFSFCFWRGERKRGGLKTC
ncbi:MAG TPA: penicillin binding protein [Clostridiaceae bacterium]|jgi:beta-lactamase regulating signal transducer with metallopeptidase domain|nr:penicillin binding protein [Clostridiaceae bacterium]HBG37656.1 penicillin binding protein [Clostridiaceae bacterium]HBN28754.1 penicillin binding protein [Clostridiaceae bacterium]HBX47982.1 penicillin binding protein [Clostridiaceae bacterium]